MNLLFDLDKDESADIPGLTYLPEFISCDLERSLIQSIDDQSWIVDLKRRVQHYGYRYDYKARRVTRDAWLGALSDWIAPLACRLYDEGLFETLPDQAIVNEYLPGQGISAHIDCAPCFGETIASLSLGSQAVMRFANPKTGERQEMLLQQRSLIVLSGAARYDWTHQIPARKSDLMQGFRMERGRRVSLTFRTVIV